MNPSIACQIIVAGSVRPAWTEGGLRKARPGSASRAPSLGDRSTVDFPEYRIDRAHDRHDVGYLVPGHDVRQDREVREGRAPPFQPIRLGSAVADDVASDLAARAFDPRVALALGHPDLGDRLHARPRRDRALGEPVERLPDDPDRLAELDHPHAVARVAIPRGLHRYDEVEVAIGRIRLGAPDIVRHS